MAVFVSIFGTTVFAGNSTLSQEKQELYQKVNIPEGVLWRIGSDSIPEWANYKGYSCEKKYFSNKDYYYYIVSYQDPNNLKVNKVVDQGTKGATEGAGESFLESFFEGDDLTFKERLKNGLKGAGKTTAKNIAKNTAVATYDTLQEEKAGLNKDREYYMCKVGISYPIVCYKTVPTKNNENFISQVTNGYKKIESHEKTEKSYHGDRYRYVINKTSRIDMFTGAVSMNKQTKENMYDTYYYIRTEGLDDGNAEIVNYMNQIFGFNFKK